MDEPVGIERRLVLRVLNFWRKLAADRLPAWSEIDPHSLGEIEAHHFILELRPNGPPVFVVLGAAIAATAPGSMVGRPVTEVPPDSLLGQAVAYWDEVVRKVVPVSRGGRFSGSSGNIVLYRSILLPLSGDGGTIERLLGAANCREVPDV